jgi:hypothetical protein
MTEKGIHATTPRLPNVFIDVSSPVEDVLLGAKIEVTKNEFALILGQVALLRPH